MSDVREWLEGPGAHEVGCIELNRIQEAGGYDKECTCPPLVKKLRRGWERILSSDFDENDLKHIDFILAAVLEDADAD